MKKLLTGIVMLALSMNTLASAAEYKITAPRTEQLREGTYEEELENIDVSMMMSTALLSLTDTKDVFTQIKVETKNDKPVVATLKIELPQDLIAEGSSAVEYMDVKIVASDETVIFDETAVEKTDEEATEDKNKQNILLGIMNEEGKDYEETFDIHISANDNIKLADVANKLTDVVWTIELNANDDVVAAAKKAAEADKEDEKPAKTIKITVDKATDKDGGKVAAGDYRLIGVGSCQIKTPEGKRDVSFTLSDKESEAVAVTLKEGDEIIISGGEDAKLQLLSPVKATQKPAASTTKTPTATKAPTNKKANPKTGDTSPVVRVSVAALMAMGAMVFAARSKKRED